MAESEGAKNTPSEQQLDSAMGISGESAVKAIAHLQKVAKTLAADAARLENSAPDDAKCEAAGDTAKAEAVEIVEEAPAPISAASAPGPKSLFSISSGAWGRAAAVGALGIAVAGSAYLGMRDGAARQDVTRVAAVEQAKPAPESATERELRLKLAALTQEMQSLRALAHKQATDLHSVQARASAAAAGTTQATARIDKLEHETIARIDQQTAKVDQQTARIDQQIARIERLERLMADPVVTSSIDKNQSPKRKAEPQRQGLRAPDMSVAENSYVLRSVRNGVAVVQTRRGLIEVGPGDTIPGVGQVKRIEKIDGRWVVVMRDGVIDSD